MDTVLTTIASVLHTEDDFTEVSILSFFAEYLLFIHQFTLSILIEPTVLTFLAYQNNCEIHRSHYY